MSGYIDYKLILKRVLIYAMRTDFIQTETF